MSPHLSCFGEKLISTPNLDALAKDGVKFTNTYTVSGVCAPSRNGIITAMYPMAIGGDNMRNYQPGKRGEESVTSRVLPSYSIVPPSYVKCFPEYLRAAGYYCSNNPKEDYQFEAPVTVWDESGGKAHWKNRNKNQPFFAVFNLGVTHESKLWERDDIPLLVNPEDVTVPPYYPDVYEVRKDIARNLSNVVEMDKQAGALIKQLKDSGLYDNAYIFFYSDHGDGLPYVKREITKRGLHIPLIVKYPNNKNAGTENNSLVSAIDFGPTVLSIAGIDVPKHMQGQNFLYKTNSRKYVFAARDRMDSAVDRVRTVFDGRYQYIKNYMPEKSPYQNLPYRMQIASMRKIIALRDSGKLNETQMKWFAATKPVEELYDVETDPYQLTNIINNKTYSSKLKELKEAYNEWYNKVGDVHVLPELELRNKMWDNNSEAPQTTAATVSRINGKYKISCSTQGASIGYKINNSSTWKVYTETEDLVLVKGDFITVNTHRIGYKSNQTQITITE